MTCGVSWSIDAAFASPPVRTPRQFRPQRLAVLGGGISGLAAAHRLHQLAPEAELRVFEASDRLGGALDTVRSGGLILERGADSFLTREPGAVELCRELGLAGQLLSANAENRRALVVARGRLHPVPDGFVLMQAEKLRSVLTSPVLSLRGKLRLLAERWMHVPIDVHEPGYDESVASFARRRLGQEAYERLVQPLLAGIYVADATRLSLAATMPEFLAAEREHGSLRRSIRRRYELDRRGGSESHSGARYGAFVTLNDGMSALVDALAAQLPSDAIRLNTVVADVARTAAGRWRVTTHGDDLGDFDGVVAAIPARRAAAVLKQADPRLNDLLVRIAAASSVVVTLVYESPQIGRALDGFGLVVPEVERRRILAASFASVKFPNRGAPNLVPIRVFLGGALHPDVIDRGDDELIDMAKREMAELIEAKGEPAEQFASRWREAMPQYEVGHLKLAAEIEARVALHEGLELAGNSYRGVGIPQCIRSGRNAAERLVRAWA